MGKDSRNPWKKMLRERKKEASLSKVKEKIIPALFKDSTEDFIQERSTALGFCSREGDWLNSEYNKEK